MNFYAVSRCARRDADSSSQQSAAETVRMAKASAVLESTSGTVADTVRESAAGVAALMQSCLPHHQGIVNADPRGVHGWCAFDAGLSEIQERLAARNVPAHVFQRQLLLTLRSEDAVVQLESEMSGTAAAQRDHDSKMGLSDRIDEWPYRLDVIWRLHESGMLPLCRLLEANETLPAHYFLGGGSWESPCEDCTDGLVRDMRALALQATRLNQSRGNQRRDLRRDDMDREPPGGAAGREEAFTLLADVARYLFDLSYRKVQGGNPKCVGLVGGGYICEALSTTAARRVLDRLCCGRDILGFGESRLPTCRLVLAAVDPTDTPASSCGENYHCDLTKDTRSTTLEDPADLAMPGGKWAKDGTGNRLATDNPIEGFLARQLRLLMESASGRHVESSPVGCPESLGCEEGHSQKTKAAALDSSSSMLVDIMRHFPSSMFIGALRSVCRRAVASAANSTGPLLHKPLLHWETLSPIVRAAAMAHPRDTPHAIALFGTELVEAGVNLTPPDDSSRDRDVVCDRRQGVLVLGSAIRLVAAADVSSQNPCADERGFYHQWFRSCFGVTAQETGEEQPRLGPNGHEEEGVESADVAPEVCRMEVLRKAMEKERPSEILVEALCSSVPYDPAFVLEVHRDVLKTRLRAKFSGRVRDLVDLTITRLSDLKGRDEADRQKATGRGHRDGSLSGISAAHRRNGDEGDSTNREVGFFLRHFQRSGEIPPALRTAILWQPKSWAKFRKILLAPPGERIVMPDENGNVVPGAGEVVSETIGHGQGGLRVEVSLKYRRLLVQQLAKDSLLSTKDYDAFKKAFTEYLQGQRERDAAQSEARDERDVPTAVRQLWLLESQLKGRDVASKCLGDRREGGLSVQERLALVLQEYLPRALVLELGIEDGSDRNGTPPYEQRDSPSGSAGSENSGSSSPYQAWFARAAHLLMTVLREWERASRKRSTLSPKSSEALNSCDEPPSAEEVTEAILNGVHCCVAAVGTLLGEDWRNPIAASCPGDRYPATAPCDSRVEEQKRRGGRGGSDEQFSPGNAPTSVALNRGLRAFRLIGEIVSTVAGLETIAEALAQRAFSLLGNPSRLDPRQVLSLVHIVASLPPSFHSRVELLMEKLVTKALAHNPGATSLQSPRRREDNDKLLATAQLGALYVKSVLVLHNRIITRPTDRTYHETSEYGQRKTMNDETGGECSYTPRVLGRETTGFTPAVLLDFLWWMERRLRVVHMTYVEQGCSMEARAQLVYSPLRQLLASVMEHPLVKGSYITALGGARIAMPAVERLLAIETAASDKSFFEPATTLAFLESVTLGRLLEVAAKDCEGGGREGGGVTAMIGSTSTNSTTSGRPGPKAEASNLVSELSKVWGACVKCLFEEPRLVRAAYRRVLCQSCCPHAFSDSRSVQNQGAGYDADGQGGEGAECRWVNEVHPAWSEGEGDSARHSGQEGLGNQQLLDAVLHVLRKLCDLQAVSDLTGRRKKGSASLKEEANTSGATDEVGNRKAAVFLQAALSLAKETQAINEGAEASALVLVAEIAIPAIGATEGREAATTAFRRLWQEYFCHFRPLGPAAVASLSRIAFMWCEGPHDTERGACQGNNCPGVELLEGLPFLAVEMTRVWPRLAGFPSMLCIPGSALGSYALTGCALHLSSLHRVGREFVHNMADGSLQRSGTESGSSIGEPPLSSTASERAAASKPANGSVSVRGDGRIPLEPLQNGSHDTKKQQKSKSQGGRDWQAGESQEDEQRAMEGATRAPHDPRRKAAAAMPNSCAELALDIIDAAATILASTSRKRPREARHAKAAPDKKVKSEVDANRAGLARAVKCGNNTPAVACTGTNSGLSALEPSQGDAVFCPPTYSAWASQFLKPLYGPVDEQVPPARSPLRILLVALITSLGNRNTRNADLVGDGEASSGGPGNDGCEETAHLWAVSLVVAILGFVPSLFLCFLEAPCLQPTAAAPRAEWSMGRSLAVLECLSVVHKEKVVFSSVRRKVGAEAWLTGVLSHYSVVWHSVSDTRSDATEADLALKPRTRHVWEEVVAFVHKQLGDVSPKEVRRIPVANMLQNVDPLMKQYF